MNNLYLVFEFYTNGYNIDILSVISLFSVLCAIFVIVSKNPIVSVLFLIGLFAGISSYLIIIGLTFIGLSYLIVYIGAVAKRIFKLFLFKLAAWERILLYEVHLMIHNFWAKYEGLLIFLEFIDCYLLNLLIYAIICSTPTPARSAVYYSAPLISQKSYQKKNKVANRKHYSTQVNNEKFLRWFTGFSDAEGNFNIIIYKDKLGNISSVSFRFKIELHVDDKNALIYIKKILNMGNDIAIYDHSCRFTVTHPKDIYKLIEIFDKYNLNTTKYLDYLDFKKAFKIYQERIKTVKDQEIFNIILNIKNGMNNNRSCWDFPVKHNIVITDYWLLGLIEGEGSFYLDRSKMEPILSITQSNIQHALMEKIKDYLIDKLGFDKYSLFKLNNSSHITIISEKARNNSKPLSVIRVKNTNVLNNYLIPYLDKMTFITKKGLDYNDFKVICKAIYDGVYRLENIKKLILKLSFSMNKYRLSTNSDIEKVQGLDSQELAEIIDAKPTIIHLKNGLQLDIISGKSINRRWTNCIFEIVKNIGEVSLATTLTEAAEIVGVDFRTLKKHLEADADKGEYVVIKIYKIKIVAVFNN